MPIFNPTTGLYEEDLGAAQDLFTNKAIKLQQRTDAKREKLGNYSLNPTIGTTDPATAYDADTFYAEGLGGPVTRGSRAYDGSGKLRLGTPGTGIDGGFVNAPESPDTIRRKFRREPTPQEIGAYQASIMAKDNYASGTLAGTPDTYADIINSPLSQEEFKLYKDTITAENTFSPLEVHGDITQLGYYGRGIGEVFNPNNPQGLNERLQDRLLATGNAVVSGGSGSIPSSNIKYAEPMKVSTAGNRVENLVDAGQYGIGRTAAGIGDALVDASTRGYMEIYKGITGASEDEAVKHVIDNSSLFERDAKGNFIGLDDYKTAKEYGYDNTRVNKATEKLGEAARSGDTGDMFAAVMDGVYTAGPEWFMESAGELAAAFSGTGTVLLAGKYSNEILEERAENVKGDLTNGDRLMGMATGTATALLNKLGADEIVGNTKVVKSIINAVGKPGGKSVAKNVLSTIAAKTAEVSGKGVYEGLEEVAQEIVQKFGAKYGTEAQAELLSSETGVELFQAFGGGFAGGATASLGGTAVGGVVPALGVAGKGIDAVAAGVGKILPDNKSSKVAKDATTNNPTANKDNIATYAQQATSSDSLRTIREVDTQEGPIVPTEVDTDAGIAVNKELSKAAGPVATTADEVTMTPELEGSLNNFDVEYDKVVELLRNPTEQIAQATAISEEAGIPVSEAAVNLQSRLAQGADQVIPTIISIRNRAKAAGAGPNQIAKMDDKIYRLVPFTTATNIKELKQIIDEAPLDVKVRNVIGSSAASYDDVVKVLEEAGDNITADQKALLEFKAQAIKNYKNVAGEKLLGGGVKPGALQWANYLTQYGYDEKAVSNIRDFLAGQNSKQRALEEAIRDWDVENEMPWTLTKEAVASKYPEFKGRTGNNENSYRSSGVKAQQNPEVTVKYGPGVTKKFPSILPVVSLLEVVKNERETMSMLKDLANKYEKEATGTVTEETVEETSPEAQKGTQEVETEVTGPIAQEEVKEAPKAPEEVFEELDSKEEVLTPEELDIAAQARAEVEAKEVSTTQDEAVNPANEILAVAKDEESKYNAGTKEAVLQLIKTHPGVQNLLQKNKIDTKDC